MPAPYPQEFRDDVVRVAQNREPGTHLKQIAKDFGISFSCLTNWMRQAEIEAGNKPGTTATEAKKSAPKSVSLVRTPFRYSAVG